MSTNCLKTLALIFMLIDHIGEFIPNSPVFLRYIGRLAAPLFFFCSVWGLHHTKNKAVYITRLYLLGVFMGIVNACFSYHYNIWLRNNIFTTLFAGSFITMILESANTPKKKMTYATGLVFYQILAFFICALLAEFLQFPSVLDTDALYYLYGAIFGSCIFTEGSVFLVCYYCLLYLFKDNTRRLFIFHVLYSLMITYLSIRYQNYRGLFFYLIPFTNFQGLMILAAPFYLLYNGRRGKNLKYFYYIFYPVHIWILCIIKVALESAPTK